jgi:2-keto-4-pentenoate hydratase/2-oxohepta-3-ene-1,7-dioic acid hydratase in catechol pathway
LVAEELNSYETFHMRLVTFQTAKEKALVGILIGEQVFALDHDSFPDMNVFLSAGTSALDQANSVEYGKEKASRTYRLADVTLLAPVPKPSKIIAVGLNYRDHAIETKLEIPQTPIIFAKFPSSITGPDAPVVLPKDDPQADYEAELGVVIGRTAKAVSEDDAMKHVAGYLPLNDVSARRWQFADKQWVRGKSPDTFCPTGPWLTTRDAVPDPHTLAILMRINGTVMQNSNTSNLIFRIPTLIAFISAAITLEPGDIIATGTPDGVGVFRKPPVFLKSGDVMEVDIEGLGVLKNVVA